MISTQLRLYRGPEDDRPTRDIPQQKTARQCVTLPVGDVLPLLAEAVRDGRAWVEDFADDEMTISADLHEVLMAYRYLQPVA